LTTDLLKLDDKTIEKIRPPISVELVKYTKTELRFRIKDEDKHSLPYIIARLALEEPSVTYAAYIIDHPLTSYPEVVILTDGSRDPLEVLVKVLNDAMKNVREFIERFEEALKAYEERK